MATGTETTTGTKDRIIDAAVRAIRTRGSAGASARTIGEIGGFNQALIYYHFGNLNGLLVAALRATSAQRLDRYRRETEAVRDLPTLISVGRALYAEDVAQGYLTVLSELASACVTHPDLRPEVLASLQPWIDLAQGMIERLLEGSPFAGTLPTRDLAQALVAAYMGMEMLHHLDGDTARTERLFDTMASFAPLLSPLLGGA
jgi:AcrR family transcriptional regulator